MECRIYSVGTTQSSTSTFMPNLALRARSRLSCSLAIDVASASGSPISNKLEYKDLTKFLAAPWDIVKLIPTTISIPFAINKAAMLASTGLAGLEEYADLQAFI